MSRFLSFILVPFTLVAIASAHAQWQPPDYTSPTYGVHAPNMERERAYERSLSAPRQTLSNRAYQDPRLGRGADHWYPTQELQLQHDRNVIEDYNAGYGSNRRSQRGCNSWTLEGC